MEAERAETVVPDLVVRALSGTWVPSRRHLVATPDQLAVMMGVTPDVAKRAQIAASARRLALEAKSEKLAAEHNGWPESAVSSGRKLAAAGAQLRAAVEGLA
jgi:hypothetical protein